ncbi:hypothetical protein BOX15_Mlig000821g2 [Macrostomum lignano]|uniref:F-box domain-containing protein n=1 Tax=Macrostomum lignano TaxID=282301 RepID=A0A267DUU2_9PLAT|nr:hypothetical protein BOX15_Mlig000821g2 [Macrostomum lignano]
MAQPCSPQHSLWCNLPQLAFYRVLESLDSLADIEAVSLACRNWHFLVNREAFWSGYLARSHPNYRRSDPLPPVAPTRHQLARLIEDSKPDKLECQCGQHSDEVLHVAAPDTPDGRYFATASKDGTVKLWLVCNPGQCYRTLHFNKAALIASLPADDAVETHRLELVSQFDWLYCQYVEFQPFAAESGDVILISGAKREAEQGEIAIYNVEMDQFLSRAELQPYDVFGCFLDSYHYLSGTFELNHFDNTSVTRVLIHRIGLLTSNERLLLELRNTPESASLQAYVGHPAATVRRLMVAQGGRMCLGAKGRCRFNNNVDSDDNSSNQYCGRFQTRASRLQYEFESNRLPKASDVSPSVRRDPAECRCREKLLLVNRGRNNFLSECVCVRRLRHCRPPWIGAYERHLNGFHGPDSDAGFDPDADPCRWASRSIYSLSEQSSTRRVAGVGDNPDIDADEWEVTVGGHVIGMSLSQDHRFLFVNVRPWRHPQAAAAAAAVGDAADWDLAFAAAPAAIGALELSESAEIHVLDLLACRYFGCVYTGHKGFTPSQQCFFLFMDVGSQLVCSGSEDCQAYVWDRIYGTKLCTLRHDSVVNACALSACGLLATASDDCTVKFWSSRRYRLLQQQKRLKQQKQQEQQQPMMTRRMAAKQTADSMRMETGQ